MKEIVIKIPDNTYKTIKNDIYCGILDSILYDAIKNGTELPKGHGRLIDADALYDGTKLCHTEEDGTACVEWREINDAPTLVEADKGEE